MVIRALTHRRLWLALLMLLVLVPGPFCLADCTGKELVAPASSAAVPPCHQHAPHGKGHDDSGKLHRACADQPLLKAAAADDAGFYLAPSLWTPDTTLVPDLTRTTSVDLFSPPPLVRSFVLRI